MRPQDARHCLTRENIMEEESRVRESRGYSSRGLSLNPRESTWQGEIGGGIRSATWGQTKGVAATRVGIELNGGRNSAH